MVRYTVTSEITTPIITRILRFFRLKEKRDEFQITSHYPGFKPGEKMYNGVLGELLILKKD